MRLRRAMLGAIFVTGWLAPACTSVDVEPPPASPGENEGGAPAPTTDAGDSDPTFDGGVARRPEVTCGEGPCYLAVSGSGGRHVCGVLKDGTVRCWGRDTMVVEPTPSGPKIDGALGRGAVVSTLEGATPAPVAGLEDVTQISVGPNLGTCARTSDGSVLCWGRNEFGQLGQPVAQAAVPTPTRVPNLPPVDFVALGWHMGCAIGTADHALYCWGRREAAITGDPDAGGTSVFEPQRMTQVSPPVRELAIGSSPDADTIVLLLDGGVGATLGRRPIGESSVVPELPVPVPARGLVRTFAFGYLNDQGRLFRWYPRLEELYIPSPGSIVDFAIALTEGGRDEPPVAQGAALLSSGRFFRWGPNVAGALGVKPDTLPSAPHPVEMKLVTNRVVSFATTIGSTCASLVDGSVQCWGSNLRGELGRGTIDALAHPEAEVIQ